MARTIYFLLSIVMIFGSSIVIQAQNINKEIEGQILVEKNSEFYTFRAAVINKTAIAQNLNFEFSVFRTDPKTNNTTKSSQKNLFTLNSFEKKILSSVTINYSVEDKIVLLVIIYDQDNKPLGRDRIVLENGGKTILNLKKPVAPTQDGVFLEGVISQKTLTKSGRDFARDFSLRYYNAQIHSPKNIFIKEVPGRRRNTLITVEVENTVVWQFFAQPRKEYLRDMVQRSLGQVTRYIRISQQQEDQVISY